MQRIIDEHSHGISAQDLVVLLGVDPEKGLDVFEVQRRREKFGANVLAERKAKNPWVHFLLQFHQPLIYILLVATVVTTLLGEYVDAMVIFAVVALNAIMGFIQEAKALKAIHALSRNLTSSCAVLRAGKREVVSSEELVPGDIVFLQSGDKVPADVRLIRQRDLQINESVLTGESVATHKEIKPLPKETPLGDRINMAFSSTLVTYGAGTAVVVATGDATEIGRISEMIASTDVLQTPLTKKIHAFSNALLYVVIVLAGIAFVAGLLRGSSPADIFMISVAIAVGVIPEGLPAAVTIIMAIGVSRMAARRTIIRRLPAVETLGSTTVICSDKTGTLTQNQMTVLRVFSGNESFLFSASGYAPTGGVTKDGQAVDAKQKTTLLECLQCGLLCNEAEVVEEEGLWKVEGDPTEGALVSAAWKAGLVPDQTRSRFRRLDTIPFESHRQCMATMHDQGSDRSRLVYLKGSLESLLVRCRGFLTDQGQMDLDPDAIRREADRMAGEGLRVLALAKKELLSSTTALRHEEVFGDLLFLGLAGMMDPPREEAAAAISACQKAGIMIKMITGDHALTAASIAQQIGISVLPGEEREVPVMTGRELEKMSDHDLIERVENVPVFARVSPDHKLRLVKALQARGHVVAMTGDGVNDAPALRRANIGIAMALGGTEVAREASDMILTDDNFASIEAAVEEGRGVFDNLQKFIVWTLPTNGAEGLVLLVTVLLGSFLPVLPVQILWINMMTAVCLGMMLAFEPKEPRIMERPPNDPGMPILTPFLIERILLVSALLCGAVFGIFQWELWRGSSIGQARTAAVATIIAGELFYLFNCRSLKGSLSSVGFFSNPWIWVGMGLTVILQIAFTYLPIMNRLFHSQPLDSFSWAAVLGCGALISLLIGAEKMVRRRFRNE